MKLKYILLAIVIGSGTMTIKAQDYDFGLFGGLCSYEGDLAPGLDNGIVNAFRGTRPAIGAIARYNFHPNFSVRGNLNFGWIAAYDKYGNEGTGRESRNLSFNSPVVELSAMLEVNLKKYIAGSKKYKWAPYLFAGAGISYTNPKTWDNGTSVSLRKLNTEPGKSKGQSAFQPVIPMGGGLKFNFKHDFTLGIEAGWRMMFTDYLDDVSTTYTGSNTGSLDDRMGNRSGTPKAAGTQRGNPERNDSYIFYGFTITKTIRPYKCR